MGRKSRKDKGPPPAGAPAPAPSAYPCVDGTWWQHALAAAALVALTLWLYRPAVELGFFHVDDPDYVVNNPLIRSLSPAAVWRLLSAPYFANYSPLHLLSYAIDYAVDGLNPAVFHFSSNLWAGLVAVGVYAVAVRLLRRPVIGLAAGVLFTVHPVHVEAVAWVSSRKDLVAAAFALPAVAAYLAYRRGGRRMWAWYVVSVLMYTCGIAGKQSVAVVPGILFCFDLFDEKRREVGMFFDKIPFAVVTIFFAWRTMGAQPGTGHSPDLYTAGISMLHDLWLLSGAAEHVIYRLPPAPPATLLLKLAGAAAVPLVLCLPLALWRWLGGRGTALAAWVVLGLIPPRVLSFVHPVSDRYLFFPTTGFAVLLGLGGVRLLRNGKRRTTLICAVAALAVAGGLAVRTRHYLAEWRDPRSVWFAAASKSADPLVFQYLGGHYMKVGDALARAAAEALPAPSEAIRLARALWADDDRLAALLANWRDGVYRSEFDRAFRAELDRLTWDAFEQARTHQGRRVLAALYFRRGKFLAERGQVDAAQREFATALEQAALLQYVARRVEMQVRTHQALGVLAWRRADYRTALEQFQEALRQQQEAEGNWVPDLARQCDRLKVLVAAPEGE